MTDRPRQPVEIANRADGGIFYWLGKLYLFAGATLLAAMVFTGFLVYRSFANRTPPIPDLRSYAGTTPAVSRIFASDGTLLGEFAAEWREVVPYERIPEDLINAVLAVEDHEFFDHHGIYFKGIVRALWANVVAGDFQQGGSTITQQVAKQFLGDEKSLTRKAKEAIMARRLEASYSKRAILSVYLNHIYLGAGAYGVEAAALRYFSKELAELTLGEAATLAGLPQAPSYYSPLAHPERARERRDEVLERMVRYGFVDAERAEAARAEPLQVHPYDEIFPDRQPYFAEHVRRYIDRRYGSDALLKAGLRIETTAEPTVEAAAYENVDFGARKQDKRQGWRGPVTYLDGSARDTFLERAEARYGDGDLELDRRYLGLVTEVGPRGAKVQVGARTYPLPLENMRWASPWSRRQAINDEEILAAGQALKAGDVVWVSRENRVRGKFRDWHLGNGANPQWLPPRTAEQVRRRRRDDSVRLRLEQVPHQQVSIFTADHGTGYVVAMVGGTDFARSQYNRAVQACRQPGSTYKPIYYSAALDAGFGFDTMLNDVPQAEVDPDTGDVWTPVNLNNTVDHRVTLEYAMVFSKNVPSVDVFKRVGARNVEAWARRLGFTTPIIADQALALGASCTTLDELTRAFAIFARNGTWLGVQEEAGDGEAPRLTDWSYVRRIHDRNGALLEDNTVYYDPMLSAAERLDRLAATAGIAPHQAIPARAGYLTNKLLAQTIRFGFSWVIRQAGVEAAGKTGTSSATMDMLFTAYTSRWITSTWMGDDQRVRPLGIHDAAYMTVEPLWTRYMAEATRGHPNLEIPWEVPEGVDARDRGEHSKGERGPQSNLVYRRSASAAARAQERAEQQEQEEDGVN